jgi:hypothetical protein
MSELTSLVLRTYRQFTVVLRPEAMVTGLVAAWFLRAFGPA